MPKTLTKAIQTSWMIIKIVLPIYILADILYFYNILSYISFIIKPVTSILSLPEETALAIISGIFLNLYAAIAFAAPIAMDNMQWSILAIFLGVCHSMVVESMVMKQLSIPIWYSYLLRFFGGLLIAYSATFLPPSFFGENSPMANFQKEEFDNIYDLLANSFYNGAILTVKIMILVSSLILIMDFIKSRKFVQNSKKNVSKSFSIIAGLFLGITYGAGILIQEKNNINKKDLFFIGTFLMICHAVIEDPLLFVMFGADFTVIVVVRILWAIILSYIMSYVFFNFRGPIKGTPK